MKYYSALSLALAILVIFSCKKDNNPDLVPAPGPVPGPVFHPDTLSTGWKKIQFIDSTIFLNDIFFVGNTGFCISSNNIFKTTDAGVNWTSYDASLSQLYNLGMGSDTNAIFLGSNNLLIVTHNGGITLDRLSLPDLFLSDVFFVNTRTAYVAGKSIWKTTDGGDTWTKLYEFAVADGYKSLYFIDDQTGWVIRKDGLYKTINGGVDWQLINSGSLLSFSPGSVFFPDASHGFISDQVSIASSNNGGVSWNKTYAGTAGYHDIHFISADTGYITDKQYILKTIDGGITWNKVVVLPGKSIIEIHFTDSDHGWACGTFGALLKYEK